MDHNIRLRIGIWLTGGTLIPIGNDRRLAQAIIATLDCPLLSEILEEAAKFYKVETSTSAYLGAWGLSGGAT